MWEPREVEGGWQLHDGDRPVGPVLETPGEVVDYTQREHPEVFRNWI